VPRNAAEILTLGQALAPLRRRGVLLVGSGGVVHNLGRLHWDDRVAPVDPWAHRFDEWIRGRLEQMDLGGISEYRAVAPEAKLAVPTSEHFDPIFFVLGAASAADHVVDVYEGFRHGNLSMRTFMLR
ncbi:MAG: dioxygenase, partial [Planctomycetes bacterium]|nr:dioxygenase [Planctomycetota bacterium]